MHSWPSGERRLGLLLSTTTTSAMATRVRKRTGRSPASLYRPRARGPEATVHHEALERLKALQEARAFIVDDDGLGYGDEGKEEDWSKSSLPLSSSKSDGESERPKQKKAEKREPQSKKPSASYALLSAATDMIGKQRLSSMFTSLVLKKGKDEKAKGFSGCDSIVDDVIAEFASDENDRERQRKN
nr:dna polymerase alpha catalytic subunit [Quercus suber]